MSQELAKSDLLRLTPPDSRDIKDNVVRPCEDDDHVGRIGISFSHPGSEAALRDFYLAELPSRGWTSKSENPPSNPSQGLDLGLPGLCFENSTLPGVALNIYPARSAPRTLPPNIPADMADEFEEVAASPNFLEFHFNEQGSQCADMN